MESRRVTPGLRLWKWPEEGRLPSRECRGHHSRSGLKQFLYVYVCLTCTLVTTAGTEIERLLVQAPCKGLTSIASFTPRHNPQVGTLRTFISQWRNWGSERLGAQGHRAHKLWIQSKQPPQILPTHSGARLRTKRSRSGQLSFRSLRIFPDAEWRKHPLAQPTGSFAKGQLHQSRWLTRIWGLEDKPGATVNQLPAQAPTAHPAPGASKPPRAASLRGSTRVRGARGATPRASARRAWRAAGGARGRAAASALARALGRGCVGWGGS